MNARLSSDPTGAATRRPFLQTLWGARCVFGWGLLLLLLGLVSAAPARAQITVDATNSPYTIDATNSPFTGTITVASGGVLNVVDGAQTSGDPAGIVNTGGTVNISGASISSTTSGVATCGASVTNGAACGSGGASSGTRQPGLAAAGGTVSATGGSFSANAGIDVDGGAVSIAGGSISGSSYGIYFPGYPGTVGIYG